MIFTFFFKYVPESYCMRNLCKDFGDKSLFSILNKILHNDNGYTMSTKFIYFSPFNSCLLQFCSLNFLT